MAVCSLARPAAGLLGNTSKEVVEEFQEHVVAVTHTILPVPQNAGRHIEPVQGRSQIEQMAVGIIKTPLALKEQLLDTLPQMKKHEMPTQVFQKVVVPVRRRALQSPTLSQRMI